MGGLRHLDRLPKLSPCDELGDPAMADRPGTRLPRLRFTLWQMITVVLIIALLMGRAPALASMAINVLLAWRSRRRVERLGGALLLQVVRPWLKRVEAVWFVPYATVLMASLGCIELATRLDAASTPASDSAFQLWLLSACMSLLFWLFLRWERLEFREGGVMYGTELWPWESIREWRWKDGGYTLRLKVPYRILWYRIAQGDKASVQAILEKRLGLVRNPS